MTGSSNLYVVLMVFVLLASSAFAAATQVYFCKDADGKDYYTSSSVTYGYDGQTSTGQPVHYEKTATDVCSNGVLTEYTCLNSQLSMSTYKCENGCAASSRTGSGACAQAVAEVPKPTVTTSYSCSDSDGGSDYFEKGTATQSTYVSGTQTDKFSKTDFCGTKSVLSEYYCDQSNKIALYDYTCQQGYYCSDGACVKTSVPVTTYSCSETDQGYAPAVKGTTTAFTYTDGKETSKDAPTDYCLSSSSVYEYYCDTGTNKAAGSASNCASGQECKDGACVLKPQSQKSCTDSDGSANQFSYGTVTYVNEQGGKTYFYDSCVDSTTVNELYCSGSDVKTAALGCGTGYECSKGACVKKATPTVSKCSETDNGDNKYTMGTNTLYNSDGSVNSYSSDACKDSATVNEVICDGTQMKVVSEACGSGYQCYNGACVQSTCVDTDQGQNYYTAGKTYLAGQEKSALADYCEKEGGSKLMEYYCIKGAAGDTIGKDYTECPQGYSCSGGACVKIPAPVVVTCKDSDNGKNEYLKGTAALYKDGKLATEFTDYCPSKSQYVEYYCKYDEMDKEYEIGSTPNTNCLEGYHCLDGACVKNPVVTPKTTCSNDVDGYNIYKKGYVMVTDSSLPNESPYYYDTCYDGNTVVETLCKDAQTYGSQAEKCPQGYSCSDGACVKLLQPVCKDSDNGKSVTVKGTVTTYDSNGKLSDSSTDSCPNAYVAIEYYCSGNSKLMEQISCPPGLKCSQNSCIKTTCTDSDNGKNPTIYGETIVKFSDGQLYGINQDKCADPVTQKTLVYEFSCTDDGWYDAKLINCPDGLVCSKGVCTKEELQTSCSGDSDGYDIYVKGSVDYYDPNLAVPKHTYYDGCYSEDAVIEVVCKDTYTYGSTMKKCPEGYSCSDGACVQKEPTSTKKIVDCVDGDSGENPFSSSGITWTSIEGDTKTPSANSDFCTSDSRIGEWVCKDENKPTILYSDCPQGYSCSKGACVQTGEEPTPTEYVACAKDSDGGKNIYVKGEVSGYDKDGNPRKAEDYCSSKIQVAEVYCDNKEAQTSWLDCPDGYACDGGACKKSEKPLSPAVCKDSDNGQSPYVYGKLYYQPKGEETGKSVADYCVGRTKVQEFYCTGVDGNVPQYYWFDCPQGYLCSEGACLKQKEETKTSCSDDTDGENIFHKGSVKYINPELPTATHYYIDSCADNDTVWEAYCSKDVYAYKQLDCPQGYRCNEGACLQTNKVSVLPASDVKKAYCQDSDGFNLTQLGRVIHKSAGEKKYLVEVDECIDSNRVLENTCDGTEPRRSVYACDNGYFCSGGACVKAEIQPAPEPIVNGTATANETQPEPQPTNESTPVEQPKPVNETTVPPEPEKFTYNLALTNKWGLYSSPVSGGWGFAKISETDCNENDTVIYAYYAPLKAYLKYPALKKGGSLVAGGQGLWIKKTTEGSCKVELSGTKKLTLVGAYLYDGWNLIGAPYSETAFEDLKGTCTLASGLHYYNSDSGAWENPSSLSPGKGYFIKVNGACQLGSSADLPPPPPSG